ncbi:MAG TPA: lipopolysaccharide biosynthesis protein [Planctomycetota bacterium]|nr:lipopolysaccharide biosynthesis protein [Planctomycetota bacterium]
MSSFRKRVLDGLLWRSGVAASQQVTQILFTILLARLLTTTDFGLVAMALVFTQFAQAFSQVGFGAAVIQDQEISDAQVSALLVFHVGVNAIASLACCLAAPLAAGFFHEPKLAAIVAVLAWLLLVTSLGFPQVLLRKRMAFREYSSYEVGSSLAGNVVAVVLAFTGFGVWSLVARPIVQRLAFAACVWRVARWRPVRPQFAGIGKHLRYGLHLLGSNVFTFASQNTAPIVIGRFAGAETLGCFRIAFGLAVVPAQQVQAILTTVLLPALSIFNGDRAAFRRKAYASMLGLGLVYVPAMLGLAAVATTFVPFAYGEAWSAASTFLVMLAGVGLIKGFEHLLRCVILSTGRSAVVMRITAVETLSALAFLAIGGSLWGANGLAAGCLAAACVSGALTLHEAHRAVGGEPIFLRAITRSLLAGGAMAAIVAAVAAVAPWHRGVTLLAQILVGIALYLVFRVRVLSEEERATVRGWPGAGLVLARRHP